MNNLLEIDFNNKMYKVNFDSTPLEFLMKNCPNFKNIIICKINNKFSDLTEPLKKNCQLSFHTFEEAKSIFWHSSAHILGNALINLYPNCKLVNGPPVEEGFFYDVDIDTPISSDDYLKIENEMKKIMKRNLKFEKSYMSKSELLDFYNLNECKSYFVNNKVKDKSTVYKNGDFIDMCEGPHILSTGVVKAVKIFKNSSAYFLNDNTQKQLQRIYGISFPNVEMLKIWIKKREEAQKKDHRKIGKELDLFFFHEYSPGSCFFLPNGTHIYNKLMDFIRTEYLKRGFSEVISPNIFSIELWKKSGHYDNYKDNMFMLENENMALKPMNCPGHCMMFKSSDHSFRQMPIRYADFGVLHRNELSGALTGLTRVRRFQQDDAHIFCTKEQVKNEIINCLKFVKYVYGVFKFKFELFLSTRPEKYIGEISEWNEAENSLECAIRDCNLDFTLNEGDGAFYGPKIDIVLQDALGRQNQCATIQLDFQLPQRFNLKYRNSEGTQQTPVIIHRAILGSIERFLAIIIESYGSKLPFWLTPRQIGIVSLTDEYTNVVKDKLNGFKFEILQDSNTLNKNIKILLKKSYSLICVIGNKEAQEGTINLRVNNKQKSYKLEDFIEMIKYMEKNKIEYNDFLDLSTLKI